MNSKVFTICSFFVCTMSFAQNVGINIANPTRARLEQQGMIGNTTAIFGGDGNGIGLIANWPEIGFNTYYNVGTRYINNGFGHIQYFDPGSGYWVWDMHGNGIKDQVVTSVKKGLILSNNGRAGMSDNSGFGATLNVARPAGFDGTAYFAGQNASMYSAFNYTSSEHTMLRALPVRFNQYTTNSKLVIGNGAGLLGIGWVAPVYPLEVHGNTYQLALLRTGTQNRMTFGVGPHVNPFLVLYNGSSVNSGNWQIGYYSNTTGWYYATSDRRLKENIKPIAPMLDNIMQLKPMSYEMKFNNPGHDKAIGLIAQDVKKIFPDLVHTHDGVNSGYKEMDSVHLVNYSGLAPIVVKGLQEQQQMLDNLLKRVDKLERNLKGRGNKTD